MRCFVQCTNLHIVIRKLLSLIKLDFLFINHIASLFGKKFNDSHPFCYAYIQCDKIYSMEVYCYNHMYLWYTIYLFVAGCWVYSCTGCKYFIYLCCSIYKCTWYITRLGVSVSGNNSHSWIIFSNESMYEVIFIRRFVFWLDNYLPVNDKIHSYTII